MLFDAYREQEKLLVRYKNGSNIEGLENVLYICPNCGERHTMRVRDRSEIYYESYRCAPDDKRQVMPFVHAVKVIYEIHCAEHERV